MACTFWLSALASSFAQGGLEEIIVEKIPVSAEAVESDPDLPANAFTYRVYADMDTAYEFQAVFSLENHPLSIGSTTKFYNHADLGVTSGKDLISSLFGSFPSLVYDSYITIGAAANSKIGILIEEDVQDDKADGLVNGTVLPLQTIGEDFSVPFGTDEYSGIFTSFSGIYNVIGGEKGPTPANRVLIGQFTTDGDFSFELNIQIRERYGDGYGRYVAKDPRENEIYFPGLIYPGNKPPAIEVTNPKNRARITTGEEVSVEATATDNDGIAHVEFLLNGNEEVVDSIAPYGFSWTATGDTVLLSAIATDSLGLSDTSRVVEVFVGSFIAPEVSISSPLPETTFLAGQQVYIVAEASDTDGSITKVEFFADSSSIGEDDSAPFEVDWTPSPGSFELQAVAMDDDSLQTASVTVAIVVILESGIHAMNGAEMMMVYPNPASGNISLEFSGLKMNENYRFDVIGMNGDIYIKKSFISPDGTYAQTLDISSFSHGAYHIRLTDKNSNFLLRKLIKN